MMFKSVLMARAVVTFAVMALMTTQAQVGGSPRPGPRPPPDIPRLCDTYFYALGKGFPTYTCRNSKGEGYRCARKDCYLKNPNRQLSQLQFHQCKRYTDNGGTVEHVSFQPDEGFQVDRKRHLINSLLKPVWVPNLVLLGYTISNALRTITATGLGVIIVKRWRNEVTNRLGSCWIESKISHKATWTSRQRSSIAQQFSVFLYPTFIRESHMIPSSA
ncbi:hypothetical protein Pst134EA_032545 [Puccinia striiformis f. sp. tritici]|uniref:uncharacterized protein n=1 Tax=Puccinia striiformis f. sp. tritici TaxID=168172 RepID=UPI0020078A5B|nr:uncharacterized protein Pst134EA_032545 [Puccinia striiformis f. sp. tritici]KAH9443598.1 hypothetical protein Pst134EA_032545 [Puccinia striiformis f. sp. tritici]KAI9623003.1 hypothetical protein KEM48_009618 [Puccinia striiformis f. sp. tritici PST-130]